MTLTIKMLDKIYHHPQGNKNRLRLSNKNIKDDDILLILDYLKTHPQIKKLDLG
jgi:hypothetical protein